MHADATCVDADAVLPREPPRAPCGDDAYGEPPPRELPPARADACAFAVPLLRLHAPCERTDPLRCACPDDVASAFFSPFAFDCFCWNVFHDAAESPQRMLLRLRAPRAHDASSAQRAARNGPSRRAADACRRCASPYPYVAAHRRRRHRQPQRSACRVVQRWRRGSSRGVGSWTGTEPRCPTGPTTVGGGAPKRRLKRDGACLPSNASARIGV